MPGFRSWLQQQGIQGDPDVLVNDIALATRYAATTYLGRAIAAGREQGLSGAELATYVQRYGQVSEHPERTGANYQRLYGPGAQVYPERGEPAVRQNLPTAPNTPPQASDVRTYPEQRPSAPTPIPYKPQTGQKYRVRDQWGNETVYTEEELRTRPGGTAGLTVLGPIAMNAGSGLPAPEPAPAAGAGAPPPSAPAAPDTTAMWSPDEPAQQPMAYQAAAGRGAGQGVMYRGPLNSAPAEVSNDEQLYDPDQGPRESRPTVSSYQDPDTLNQQPLPYNGSGAGAARLGEGSTPSSGITPAEAEGTPAPPYTFQIADGRVEPPTPEGFEPWRTIPKPPPAARSPYDEEQPWRPTLTLGSPPQGPSTPPVAPNDRLDRPYDPRDADSGPRETPRYKPPETWYGRAAEAGLTAIAPALQALDAANEWLINHPVLGVANPQRMGRELAGADQMYTETHEDQQRLEALIRRYRAGDTSVEPEIQALTASLNRRTSGGTAGLLAAGERNPDKGAETAGQVAQAALTFGIAPSLGSGPVRNVVAAAMDPVGQTLGAIPDAAGSLVRGARGAGRALRESGEATAARAVPAGEMQLGSGFVPDPVRTQAIRRISKEGDLGRYTWAARWSDDIEGDVERGYTSRGWGNTPAESEAEARHYIRDEYRNDLAAADEAQIVYDPRAKGYIEVADGLSSYTGASPRDVVDAALADEHRFEGRRLYIYPATRVGTDEDFGVFGQHIERTMPIGSPIEVPRSSTSAGSGFVPTMSDARNAAQGAFVGGAAPDFLAGEDDPELTPAERLARIGAGAALGVATGRRMRPGSAGSRLGSGMVPEGSRGVMRPPDVPDAPPFYSQLRRVIDEKMPNRAAPQQVQGILKGGQVKPDEIAWSGLDDFLREQRGPVTKQQVLDFLDQNEVKIEEVVKGAPVVRWQSIPDGSFTAVEAPSLRVVPQQDGSFSVVHDGRTSLVKFQTAEEAKQAAQDIATDSRVGVQVNQGTRYDKYTMPGGENYRELLLTLPSKAPDTLPEGFSVTPGANRSGSRFEVTGPGFGRYASGDTEAEAIRQFHQKHGQNKPYQSSHWNEPNVLAHVRFSERTAPDGKRVLHIEEVQSDWHQAGRKEGYQRPITDEEAARITDLKAQREIALAEVRSLIDQRSEARLNGDRAALQQVNTRYLNAETQLDNLDAEIRTAQQVIGVPDAPFKKTWPELTVKRMIRWAAENDFDRIAWTPGADQAKRYDLSKQVSRIDYAPSPMTGGTHHILAFDKNGKHVLSRAASEGELPGIIGKELADKLLAAPEVKPAYGLPVRRLEGLDIRTGGEGMVGFYDKILPETVNKIGKKFGARVSEHRVTVGSRAKKMLGIDITPQMRQSVMKEGQPLFAGVPFNPAGAALGAGAGTELDEDGNPVGIDPVKAAGGMLVAGLAGKNFPGVQRALAASQKRAAVLAARGEKPLPPLQWMGELTKSAGYSSMIGPATATVNVFGNFLEPFWAMPKELVRAALPRVAGGRGNIREFGEMAGGAFHGIRQAGNAMIDALAARGRYASNPDSPMLSARTVNPIGHAIATGLEAGGRVFSGMPDAIFGTIARGAGEARRAAQIATDEGLKGPAWKQRVQTLLSDVEAQRAGQLAQNPGQVDDIIKAGEQYADRQTFRDQLGTVGKGASALAGRNVPVVGNLITPFFNTPWNMGVTLAERTPLGAIMNRQKGFDKAYDAVVGSALVAGLAFGPVAAGKVTGSGPDDPEKRAMMQTNGWKPYHTLIGDTYIPNRVFGIYGKLLNAAGDVHDALAYQKKDGNASEMLQDGGKRFARLLKEEPYLQGMADLMAMLTGEGGASVESYGASVASRLVPYAATARTVGTAVDTKERTTDRTKDVGMLENASQRTQSSLGARQGLPVAQDTLGREKENPTPGIWSVLPRTSQRKADPVIQAFEQAGVDIPFPRSTITIDGLDVPLTPAQQRKWQTYMGEYLLKEVPKTTKSQFWNRPTTTVGDRSDELRDLLKEASEDASERIQSDIGARQINQLIREAERKEAQKRGEPVPAGR